MKFAIEQKDLEKHYSNIISNPNLTNLTGRQIESIALAMEIAYRKGKAESNEGKSSIRNCTVTVNVDCNTEEFKEKINKVISEVFNDLSKTINKGIAY